MINISVYELKSVYTGKGEHKNERQIENGVVVDIYNMSEK